MHGLALHYYNGDKIEKDLEKTFHWYQKAAEGGIVRAMHGLALHYCNGEETKKDLEKPFTGIKKQQKVDLCIPCIVWPFVTIMERERKRI
jgi:TPR repeat protein